MSPLSGRRVLVAGATGGVGRSVALAAAAQGAHVLLLARDDEALRRLRDRIAADGGRADVALADATRSEEVREAVDRLTAAAGAVDALVNCVGVNVPARRLDELTEAAWRSLLDVNATAGLVLTQAVLPGFRARHDGQIIHIASTAARAADGSGAAYQAGKAALAALARATALEAGPDGVRVSTVFPGLIDTPFVRHRAQPPSRDELDRALQPDDVAQVCTAILGMPARAVVSEVVVVPARS